MPGAKPPHPPGPMNFPQILQGRGQVAADLVGGADIGRRQCDSDV